MIYILLPVHNRKALTQRFVECLVEQTFTDFHVVLIDDGSTDGTSEMVTSLLPRVTVLRGRGDWWWGGSLHQGYKWLRKASLRDDDLVLFINDDLTVAPDYLAHGDRLMRSRPNTFLLSQFLFSSEGRPEETGTSADLVHFEFSVATRPDAINCLSTQGLFAHWSTVRRVGGFHPILLPHYLSDYEYTIRAHRLGVACETSPELLINLNRESTGIHRIAEPRFTAFVRKLFSKKYASNPVYFTTFIWLACPIWRRIPNTWRVWRDALGQVARRLQRAISSPHQET
jgi:GT2 family glycosyltransferase